MLTYEEFNKIVPVETRDFFISFLKNNEIDVFSDDEYWKRFMIAIYTLSKTDNYCLSKYNHILLDPRYTSSIKKLKNNEKELYDPRILYDKYNNFLPQYKDKNDYYYLTPYHIVKKIFLEYIDTLDNSNRYDLAIARISRLQLESELDDLINSEREKVNSAIISKIYKDVPISVINLIEIASKIRMDFSTSPEFLKNISSDHQNDLVPLSIFLALFYIADNNDTIKAPKEILQLANYFKANGINKEKISKIIGFYDKYDRILTNPLDMITIKNDYAKYFASNNKNKVNVLDVFRRVFDRNFSNSLILERIISQFNFDVDFLKVTDKELQKLFKEQDKIEKLNMINEFYNGMHEDVVNFLDHAAKVYKVLKQKNINIDFNNKGILIKDEDYIALALYISSYKYNSTISNFFDDNGVKLNKILDFINIEIDEEEIESQEITSELVIDLFDRYVKESLKDNNNVKIDVLCKCLCNNNFTKSSILSMIFNRFNSSIVLKDDFLKQVEDYCLKKEAKEKYELEQELFKDLPLETIEVLKKVPRIYKFLVMNNNLNMRNEDLKLCSLLISILIYDKDGPTERFLNNSGIENFFEEQGIDKFKILDYLKIDNLRDLDSEEDIVLLAKEFKDLIFGFENANREHKDLDLINISRNIFSKEYYNSLIIRQILNIFDLDYEYFENFDELIEKYSIDRENRILKKKYRDTIGKDWDSSIEYLNKCQKIYQIIKRNLPDSQNLFLKNDEDIIELSMFIPISDEKYFFEPIFDGYRMSEEQILEVCGLPKNIFDSIDEEEVDYKQLLDNYLYYLKEKVFFGPPITYLKVLLNDEQKKNNIIKKILNRDINFYEYLKESINRDLKLETIITIEDKIKLLQNIDVSDIDIDDMQSILEFGDKLQKHSSFIHNDLSSLLEDDKSADNIDKIDEFINSIIPTGNKQEKQSGIFSRILSSEKENISISNEKIASLKNAVCKNNDYIKNYILKYNDIKKYIDAYDSKNKEYYDATVKCTEKLLEKLDDFDENNPDDYSALLSINSMLQMLNDKQNRFSVSKLFIQRELFKVNKAIVNDYIILNAFEIAKDDLIPTIESSDDNQLILLSMKLFSNLINRNVNGIVKNMENLKNSNISKDILELIISDISNYNQSIISNYMQSIERESKIQMKITDSESKIAKLEKSPKVKKYGQ